MDLTFPQSILSDLSQLRSLTPPITIFLISEVSRFIVNKDHGNLDMQKLSKELENEGVDISNEKLHNIVKSLKQFLFKVLKTAQAHPDQHQAIIQQVQQTLADRTALREKMIMAVSQALVNEFASLKDFQDQNNLKTFFEQIKLRHLVSFDCVLNHDFSSAECKNLKKTFATLIFKISEVDGQVKTKNIEVNLDELRQFKEEIIRIEEALS